MLKFSSELQFFEAPETAWQAGWRPPTRTRGCEEGALRCKKFFKGVPTTTSLITGKSADENEDPEYAKVKTYMQALETHMGGSMHTVTSWRRGRGSSSRLRDLWRDPEQTEREGGRGFLMREEFVKVMDKLCQDDTREPAMTKLDLELWSP